MFSRFFKPTMAFTLLGLVVAAGCGDLETDESTKPPAPPRQLPIPMVRMVAPTQISVGEDMSIFGKGFADKAIGQTRVTFDGTFQTSSGKVHKVNITVAPKYKNQGVLVWNFGPNIPFSTEEDTGTFRGTVKVSNIGLNGQIKPGSSAIGAEIQVMPSILIRKMRPLHAGCPVGITASVENTPFLFEVKAVGLKSGSQLAPMRFVYTFMKQNFQFKGYFSSQLGMDPESLFPKSGPVSVINDVTNGTISMLGNGSSRNVHVTQGGYNTGMASMSYGVDKLFGLTHLYTAPVALSNGDYYTANMNIVAVDNNGQQAKRTIQLKIYAPIEVDYDGKTKLVRSFDPVPVSGCIPGGDIGRDVTYKESKSETRQRSFKFSSKISGGFDVKVARLNVEFGVEVDKTVSSAKAKDLAITGKILPKQFGVFYRQALQLERRANLTAHGPCGNTQDLGEVIVTDWTWSPDLAKGNQCPPLPKSNLAKGKKF